MTNRVVAPKQSRSWSIAAFAAGIAWFGTIIINLTVLIDTGDSIAPQINAFGVSVAGSATVVSVALYVLRRLREALVENRVAIARLTDAYRVKADVDERLIGAVKQNSEVITDLCRQVREMGESYARLLQELGMGVGVSATRPASIPRQGRLN